MAQVPEAIQYWTDPQGKVLPYRPNQKLVFCLCRTCILTFNTGECHHTMDEERALIGSWVMEVVRLAVQKVYRIFDFHEVNTNSRDTTPKRVKAACLQDK